MICPKCHRPVPEGRDACPGCDTPVSQMTPSYQTGHEPPTPAPQPKGKKPLYIGIVVVAVVLVVVFISAGLLLTSSPAKEEPGEVKLTVADADFPGSIRITGYEPVYITVTLGNSGSAVANQSRITVTLTSSVDARAYTWSKGDIAPGFPVSETFWVNVDRTTNHIDVAVSYEGKEQDSFKLSIL